MRAITSGGIQSNLLCSRYIPVNSITTAATAIPNMSVAERTSGPAIVVNDSNYVDSTAEQFKTAMSGVMLYYELATPETYILDQTVTGGYQVNANGTERRLPEDAASSVNAPVNYSVVYPINAVKTIIDLPYNYISVESMNDFTTELATKLGAFLNATIAITPTYDQTNQKYNYDITITQNE